MNPADLTDEQLMQRFCDGDIRAFPVLYQRHAQPLYRYLCRLLGNGDRQQADDVLQVAG